MPFPCSEQTNEILQTRVLLFFYFYSLHSSLCIAHFENRIPVHILTSFSRQGALRKLVKKKLPGRGKKGSFYVFLLRVARFSFLPRASNVTLIVRVRGEEADVMQN